MLPTDQGLREERAPRCNIFSHYTTHMAGESHCLKSETPGRAGERADGRGGARKENASNQGMMARERDRERAYSQKSSAPATEQHSSPSSTEYRGHLLHLSFLGSGPERRPSVPWLTLR